MEHPHSRFSRVTENYRRYRPTYPRGLIDVLKAECGLVPAYVVADVGSGTGLLTELFLENGNRVHGVEPNAEMRSAAEENLRSHPRFTSIAAAAEATTLADGSIDMVAVGQAFHWFDHAAARAEFARILVPRGWVVLVWNLERNRGSAFGAALEQLWRKYIDPKASFGERTPPEYIARFFDGGRFSAHRLENRQVCDLGALRGRLLSASRSPREDDPRFPAMLGEIEAMFRAHQRDGRVTLEYDTSMFCGQMRTP